MKKILCISGMCGLLLFVSGCVRTRVAGVKRSQEESNWENVIRRNYSGYRPMRAAAPAIYNHTEERVSARIVTPLKPSQDPAAPAVAPEQNDDPAAVVDNAVAEPVKAEAVPAPEKDVKEAEKTAEKESEKPADKAEKVEQDAASSAKPAEVAPPEPTGSKVYVVQAGDTLGKIAQKHYGNARHSNVIFKANTDILKNPNHLRPGMKLIVPAL